MPLDPSKCVLLVGDAIVDYHVDRDLVRLGGVFHAARALHALGVKYSIAHASPGYMADHVAEQASALGVEQLRLVGTVSGAPNVIAVGESTEAGDQRYRDLLRDRRARNLDWGALRIAIDNSQPTDILLMLDGDDLRAAITLIQGDVALHVDTHGPLQVGHSSRVATFFTSTSGADFIAAGGDPRALRARFSPPSIGRMLLKENRGGSRIFLEDGLVASAPAFPVTTEHSVGVGDVFDAVWLAQAEETDPGARLALASWIAAEYAARLDGAAFHEASKLASANEQTIASLGGIRIPWESRGELHIYLAAPDFPSLDVRPLDELADALQYHNFVPHRPVREIGMATGSESPRDAAELYRGDTELLAKANLLIAVPIVDDPGTYAELGMFAASRRPTILYNPHRLPMNLFVRETATRICTSLGETVDAAFRILGQ